MDERLIESFGHVSSNSPDVTLKHITDSIAHIFALLELLPDHNIVLASQIVQSKDGEPPVINISVGKKDISKNEPGDEVRRKFDVSITDDYLDVRKTAYNLPRTLRIRNHAEAFYEMWHPESDAYSHVTVLAASILDRIKIYMGPSGAEHWDIAIVAATTNTTIENTPETRAVSPL